MEKLPGVARKLVVSDLGGPQGRRDCASAVACAALCIGKCQSREWPLRATTVS